MAQRLLADVKGFQKDLIRITEKAIPEVSFETEHATGTTFLSASQVRDILPTLLQGGEKD